MFKSVSTCIFCGLALIPQSAVLLAAHNVAGTATDQSGAAAPRGSNSEVITKTVSSSKKELA